VHGVPFYGVLIALEIDKELTVGAINMPALNEMVSAASGCGCYFNGEPARVSSTRRLEDALLLATDFVAWERYGLVVLPNGCKRARSRAAPGVTVMVTCSSPPAAQT
jgi:fructose-1,6-bisphosphatase/inositol monophosphatase family enzyme